MATILPKMNLKAMMPGERIPDPKEPTYHVRIGGSVIGSENVQTTFGASVRLMGAFIGLCYDTGEEFQSSECFLPCGVAEIIAANNPTKEKPIVIAYDIGVKPSKRNQGPDAKGEKYEYIIRTPVEDHKESPIYKMLMGYPPPSGVKALPGK